MERRRRRRDYSKKEETKKTRPSSELDLEKSKKKWKIDVKRLS